MNHYITLPIPRGNGGSWVAVRTWSKEWPMMSNAWGTVGGAPGKKAEGLLPQVHFVPWIVLGPGFHVFFVKNLHSIYKTCLFLLKGRISL